MTTTALYARLSTKKMPSSVRQESVSIEVQTEDGRAFARARGWGEPVIYQDIDSASSTKRRKGFEQLLADIRDGKIQRVVCRDDDRFLRRPAELERVIDILEPKSCPVYFTNASELDLTTSDGRLRGRIMGAVARYEVEKKAERQRQSNRYRAAQGLPFAGVRPFGYQRQGDVLEVIEAEAEAIKWAYTQVMFGATLSTVMREWNSRGLRSPKKGDEFTWKSVRYALTNPIIAGRRTYIPHSILTYDEPRQFWHRHLQDTVQGNWEAILDYDTEWMPLVQVLTKTRSKAGNKLRYLGGGIFICGLCQKKLISGTGQGYRQYQCKPSKHVTTRAALVDEYVEECLLIELELGMTYDDAVGPRVDEAEVERLRAKRQQLEKDLEDLAMSFAKGFIKITQLEAGTSELNRRITDIDRQVSQTATEAQKFLDPDEVLRVWETATIEQKREILQRVFKRIEVFPVGRGRKQLDVHPSGYVKIYDWSGHRVDHGVSPNQRRLPLGKR